jgi:hypothetical protein
LVLLNYSQGTFAEISEETIIREKLSIPSKARQKIIALSQSIKVKAEARKRIKGKAEQKYSSPKRKMFETKQNHDNVLFNASKQIMSSTTQRIDAISHR